MLIVTVSTCKNEAVWTICWCQATCCDSLRPSDFLNVTRRSNRSNRIGTTTFACNELYAVDVNSTIRIIDRNSTCSYRNRDNRINLSSTCWVCLWNVTLHINRDRRVVKCCRNTVDYDSTWRRAWCCTSAYLQCTCYRNSKRKSVLRTTSTTSLETERELLLRICIAEVSIVSIDSVLVVAICTSQNQTIWFVGCRKATCCNCFAPSNLVLSTCCKSYKSCCNKSKKFLHVSC